MRDPLDGGEYGRWELHGEEYWGHWAQSDLVSPHYSARTLYSFVHLMYDVCVVHYEVMMQNVRMRAQAKGNMMASDIQHKSIS